MDEYSSCSIKERLYDRQLSKFSELADDPFSSETRNKNYGVIPMNVVHNIMLFQELPELLSMSLSCSLFNITQNSSFFWKSYYVTYFKTDMILQCNDNGDIVHWKKKFFKRYVDVVFTWGLGVYGELGHGKTGNVFVPKPIEGLSPLKIRNLVCGWFDCCSVVLSNGDLLSWGNNNRNKLGYKNDAHCILSPEQLVRHPENRKIIQVSLGNRISFFLDEIGELWGCGDNIICQDSFHQPVRMGISNTAKIRRVVSGELHFGCICSSGKLYTWGSGLYGQIGHGNVSDVIQPQIVKYFENIRVKDVAMGSLHTSVLSEDGKVYSFGYGEFGALGILGEIGYSSSPVLIKYFCDDDVVVTKISCGNHHSGCLDSQGNCYLWGCGSYGEIGNGNWKEENFTPFRIKSFIDSSGDKIELDVPNRHKFVQLECGNTHNIAILEERLTNQQDERETRHVLTWGNGENGQLGLGRDFDGVEKVNIPTVVPFFESKNIKSVHSGGYMSAVIL